jgi:bifunctional DNase/RNase
MSSCTGPVALQLVMMVEVELAAVKVDVESRTPVILLQEREGRRRVLPIFIGPSEAQAIALAVQGVVPPRPMTHDLMRDLLDALDASLERVVVTELIDRTYYAELHLRIGGRSLRVSSRPSDAVALAVRTGSPIFVADDLLDAEGVVLREILDEPEPEEEQDEEAIVGDFVKFLDSVSPEDFRV